MEALAALQSALSKASNASEVRSDGGLGLCYSFVKLAKNILAHGDDTTAKLNVSQIIFIVINDDFGPTNAVGS